MTAATRSWLLYAMLSDRGNLFTVGERWWVELHQLGGLAVPVLVEELGDSADPAVTHFGWRDSGAAPDSAPHFISPRMPPGHPPDAMLSMCFPYGVQSEVDAGRGAVVALVVTQRLDIQDNKEQEIATHEH